MKQCLTNIFNELRDANRKSQKEARLSMSGCSNFINPNEFGSLVLFKNGEMIFQSAGKDGADMTAKFPYRNELRSNGTSAIDAASYTLSTSGTTQLTVRSNFFESLKSVRTPMTFRSTAHSLTSRAL